jgi:head-tail adaptor
MTIAFDPSADQTIFDGAEPVMLVQPGEPQSPVVVYALRRGPTRREAEPSGGQHTAADATWHVAAAELTLRPEIGAVLVDSEAQRHTVLEAALETRATRWRLRTRNLAIAGGLDRLVSFERATWTKDACGAPAAVWSLYRAGVPARIQPQQAGVATEHDRRLTRVTHKIYLAEPMDVDDNFRVTHGGEVFQVVGYERPERIDQLMVVLAVREK